MADPVPLFKFSHAGQVFQEGLTLAEAVKLIAEKAILPTDHYWTEGMTDWKLVSSRTWVLPPEFVKAPSPQPVIPKQITTPPYGSAKPASVSTPALVNAVEKGFSPYVNFYRSNDDRWAYGIFGGLAHRNCWSPAQLMLVRLTTLLFVFPAMAYLLGWGFFVLFMIPSLPTAGVRSYYDLNKGLPTRDSQDFGKIVKYVLFGFGLMVGLSLVLRYFFR